MHTRTHTQTHNLHIMRAYTQAEEEARELAVKAEQLALAEQATPVGSVKHLLEQVGG